MEKVILKMVFALTLLLGTTSCIDSVVNYWDKEEDISRGMFAESYWTSQNDGTEAFPYYTMKFSGTCHCRLRIYVTNNVDIDVKQYYSCFGEEHGSYEITDFNKQYATFKVIDDKTLELYYDGKTIMMRKTDSCWSK